MIEPRMVILSEKTQIGALIDAGDTPPDAVPVSPQDWDDEPITVCEYREPRIPAEALRAVRSVPSFAGPRPSQLPAVSEGDEEDPPLVIRVASQAVGQRASEASEDRGSSRSRKPPKAAPLEVAMDDTAPARTYQARLPGVRVVCGTPVARAKLNDTLVPRVHRAHETPIARQRPHSPRVPTPDDTILEASVIVHLAELSGLATEHDASPSRYVPTDVTPAYPRSALSRCDTHLSSLPPLRSMSFGSVALSIAFGVVAALGILYRLL